MSLLPTKLLMSWEDIGADHSDVPASFVMFSSCDSNFFKGLMSSADVHGPSSACSTRDRRSFSSFWTLLPLEDLQDPVVRTCTLRNWNPRPACGTTGKSVYAYP